jgi:hypothetical protein
MNDISRSLLPVDSLTVDVLTDDVSDNDVSDNDVSDNDVSDNDVSDNDVSDNDVSDNDVSNTLFAVSQASSVSAPRCETCLRISRSTASWADSIWAG